MRTISTPCLPTNSTPYAKSAPSQTPPRTVALHHFCPTLSDRITTTSAGNSPPSNRYPSAPPSTHKHTAPSPAHSTPTRTPPRKSSIHSPAHSAPAFPPVSPGRPHPP